MKILFLGTGAADWPAVKPDGCAEFRRLSSALIDGELLIDPGPGVPAALAEFGVDPRRIRFVINTHRHGDHFCPETVEYLSAYGAQFIDLRPGDIRLLDHLTVEALPANHATCPDPAPVHFMIEGDKTIFYGLDGAWLLYPEVAAIKEKRPDLAVLDGTSGNDDGDFRLYEHNNLSMVRILRRNLAPYVGCFCISHMARTLHTDHATLAAEMAAEGILTAYDGFEITL